jgi:hypothetical protein
MTRCVLESIPNKIFISAACALLLVAASAPLARAQHPAHSVPAPAHAPAAHAPVAAPRMPMPRVIPPPAARPGIVRPVGVGQPHSFPVFRRPIFIFVPFPRFRGTFYPLWWLNCGPIWGWQFGCNDVFFYTPVVENSVTPLIYEPPPTPVYSYLGGDRDLVRLYLKDGTVIGITDYWFVDDEIHFAIPDEAGEQVIGAEELDLQKTIDVNTRRGFRLVRRNEPMDQYVRDYPNVDPPLLQAPPKN